MSCLPAVAQDSNQLTREYGLSGACIRQTDINRVRYLITLVRLEEM